jgi:regulator of cell morphogenesis and NO signaling
MTTIRADDTLADLVTAHPALATDFERLGLDYCCGGRRTVAQVCGREGLDLDALLTELEMSCSVVAPPAWTSLGIVELVDHIEATHHVYLWDELPRLTALADKVASAHSGSHPDLIPLRDAVAELRADLEPHLRKEERVLFPMIRQLAVAHEHRALHGGTVADPIRMMKFEHDRVGELLARLRMLSADYVVPADGCPSYAALFVGLEELEADTHLHVHKENNVLFPAAERLETLFA